MRQHKVIVSVLHGYDTERAVDGVELPGEAGTREEALVIIYSAGLEPAGWHGVGDGCLHVARPEGREPHWEALTRRPGGW